MYLYVPHVYIMTMFLQTTSQPSLYQAAKALQASSLPVMSVDIPSGWDVEFLGWYIARVVRTEKSPSK